VRIPRVRSLHDVTARLRDNWKGYVQQYRLLLVLVLLASLADMATTIHFMLVHGPQAEGHPVVRMISQAFGPIFGPVLGKTIQFVVAIVVTVFLRRWTAYILIPLIILYGWAAWYNLWGHEIYYPRLLQILEHLGV
jgi:hypothetical protein